MFDPFGIFMRVCFYLDLLSAQNTIFLASPSIASVHSVALKGQKAVEEGSTGKEPVDQTACGPNSYSKCIPPEILIEGMYINSWPGLFELTCHVCTLFELIEVDRPERSERTLFPRQN